MNPWMQVTGWTLIHFVWQGAFLALMTAAGLRLCQRCSSEARYAVACAGLAAMLAAPLITAAFLSEPGSALDPGGTIGAVGPGFDGPETRLGHGSANVASSAREGGTAIVLDAWLPYAVSGWLAGVTLLLARFAGGCWRVHRIKRASLAESQSPWQLAGERLAARLHLDAAFRVVESELVDAPTVIGWMRPVILLPVAALTNLAPVQVEAILAHELMHVRRRDYAVNLLQTVAETFLFYHPGVWWVSARVRQEREHCCDDVAVEVCGEPRAYAAALVELASWRSREAALALGATDGSLLTRVRRLLRVTDDSGPRPIAGFAIVTLSMLACAGWVAVQTSSAIVASDARTPQSPANGSLVRHTDHFEIHYGPDLDLHAERVAREAERAYEQVSSDLRHNLAFRVPLVLFHTSSELQQSVQAGTLVQPHTASFTEPARDRILLAVDRPADQWYGLLTHEVAHVFLFDIVPGTATPRWLAEGLAEYQRGTWDPADLSALRDAIRANAIPKIRRLEDGVSTTDPRLVYSFGHAAFDFIESRWGKAGMRQFIFGLRQAAINGTDPYPKALQVTRDEFEQGFERYLRERFSAAADQSLSDRFDYRATLRVEGDITAINATPPAGLSCIQLWIATEGSGRRRWGVECGDGALDALRVLRPGDRVILTGPPARPPATQRMVMLTLVRPSDGFTWRGRSE